MFRVGRPTTMADANRSSERVEKKKKTGVLYLSTLPPGMSVTRLREQFEMYSGDRVGRISLTEKNIGARKKRKPNAPRIYTEGWLEILSKRRAKQIAADWNNQPIGGRKRDRWYDFVWNIKYLPGFKWIHLTEQLRFERAVRQERIRTEIALAKKEAQFYMDSVSRSERLARNRAEEGSVKDKEEVAEAQESPDQLEKVFTQRGEVEETLEKMGKTLDRQDRMQCMRKIGLFGSNTAE